MKIAQVTPYFYPVKGGAEDVVYNMSKLLSKKGHEVDVITCDFDLEGNRLRLVDSFDGFTVIRLHSSNFGYRFKFPKIHNLKKYDIVHIHGVKHVFTNKVMDYFIKNKTPAVVSIYDLDFTFNGKLPKIFSEFFKKKITSKITQMKIHVKNKMDYEILKKYSPLLIQDGIPDFITKKGNPEAFRKKYKIKEKMVLYAGRLHFLKGPQLIADSAEKILRNFPDTTFVFAGKDSGAKDEIERKAKEKGIEKNFVFTGFIPDNELNNAFEASDVLVVPSMADYVEAFSIVVSQAWYKGKPVVVSDAGALPYRVNEGENGFVFKKGDSGQLAEKLISSLSDKKLREELGKKGKESVKTWDEVVDLFEKIYSELLNTSLRE
ncbi:MAG: glycosyltransferase family 4 protein [Candidatus Nanoarchaeia archaeon]|nr:glycosyltransferase family 4 protein [Candidatus Nanoarchaeia archaeon]